MFQTNSALTIFLTICVFGSCSWVTEDKLLQVHSWKSLDFAFSSPQAREIAIYSGTFKPGAPLPIDVDTYYGGTSKSKVFVTIPRFQDGVPLTLGYVTDNVTDESSPIIAPYPDWEWNRLGSCDSITSVYRIQIDSCGRMWVLDTGKHGEKQLCRPQLLAFSLENNELLTRYRFPKDQFKEDSIFVTLVVDIRDGKCSDTFVYVADVTGFGLLVYDLVNSRSWRINNNLFYPYPPYGTFDIKGDSFDLMDGILGLALSPTTPNGDRILYFHSLASRVESWVPTSVIRNFSLFEHNPDASGRSFKSLKGERTSQSAAQVMDQNGVLFFGLMSDLAIGCWNSRDRSFEGNNIQKIVENPDTLQFPSGMKIVRSATGRDQLWILTASFQRYMSGSLTPNETNFRIQAGYLDELVRGTRCDASTNTNSIQRPLVFPE